MQTDEAVRPGRFGRFGGRYVPELLVPPLAELEEAFARIDADAGFRSELDGLLATYAGRPTPLYRTRRLSESAGARIYLKREDLLHGGAHKTNNALGQALLAYRMGKRRLLAETGAGQHGCAVAMAAALLGMEARIYMGALDVERQRPNVERMKLFGAEVVPVESGDRTLRAAVNEALRDWIACYPTTHYLFGSVAGPHPFPTIVERFQSVIGTEARAQILDQEGRLPDAVVACVGGGSNAIGIFSGFLDDPGVRLLGAEGGGTGEATGAHSATLSRGEPGILHGAYSYLLQDAEGQVSECHSIAPGLDYPGVGPRHSALKESGRAAYFPVGDVEALEAFHRLARLEGILPALESSHAVALALRLAQPGQVLLVNLSGRGDKDLHQVMLKGGVR